MHPTNNIDGQDCAGINRLGVAVKRHGNDSGHVGVLYRHPGEPVQMCHLANHRDLRVDMVGASYTWLCSPLGDINQKIVAEAIDAIVSVNPTTAISYSHVYDGPYFDQNTFKYIRSEPGDGLTCATFVMAVFDCVALALFDISTFQNRTSDGIFRSRVIEMLDGQRARFPDIAEHIEALEKHESVARFRPEEVAAAVACGKPPLSFDEAISGGEYIVANLHPGACIPAPPRLAQ